MTPWLFVGPYDFGSGILVVARALPPPALFSPRRYGRQSTRFAMPKNIGIAPASVISPALIDRTGITTAIVSAVVLAAITLVATSCSAALTPSRP